MSGLSRVTRVVRSRPALAGVLGLVLAAVFALGANTAQAATVDMRPAVHVATTNTVQPTQNPAGALASLLLAVSCSSTTSCDAVGNYVSASGQLLMLAEHWNGTTWTIQPTPSPAGATASSLLGVSCASTGSCLAVGYYETSTGQMLPLAESRTGTAWSPVPPPAPRGGGVFDGVSCTSATACTAVGTYDGNSTLLLAERWNGTTWTFQPMTNPSGASNVALNSVSCSSATFCLAVGNWSNGGHTYTLAQQWNGVNWAFEFPVNRSSSFNSLSSVTCPSATACSAVGTFTDPITGAPKTLGDFFTGSASWTVANTPSPGATHSYLNSVSCATTTSCTAGGDFDTTTGTEVTFGAFGSGTSWLSGSTPTIPFRSTYLRGVSCPSTTVCEVVGYSASSAVADVTFAGQTS